MRVQEASHMFQSFVFRKSSEEIVEKAKAKATQIRAKREERIGRLKQIRDEHGIDDAAMNEIYAQLRAMENQSISAMIYNSKRQRSDGTTVEEKATIGAGMVNMIITEQDFIRGEGDQIEKLELIVRNLRDIPGSGGVLQGHNLTYDELRFLGF